MKKVFILSLLFCLALGSLAFAKDKIGIELWPYGSIAGLVYSTDSYNVGINPFFYTSTSKTEYYYIDVWGDIKNKIDDTSSWGYGIELTDTIGKYSDKELAYDISITPYLRYSKAITDNLIFSAYVNLIDFYSTKYKGKEATSSSQVLGNAWTLTYLF